MFIGWNSSGGSGNKKGKDEDTPPTLIIIGTIFLLRGAYVSWQVARFFTPPIDLGGVIVLMSALLVGLLYVVPAVGLFQRREYGYTIGICVLLLECILPIMTFVFQPVATVIGFFVSVAMLASILKNKNQFKKQDKTDMTIKKLLTITMVVSVLTILSYVIYTQTQPTPEEYYKIVSAEARQKNDTKICDKVSDSFWRDNCIKDYATENLDVSLCETIKSMNVRDLCRSDIRERTGGT